MFLLLLNLQIYIRLAKPPGRGKCPVAPPPLAAPLPMLECVRLHMNSMKTIAMMMITRIRHVSCDADARQCEVLNVSSGERTHDGVAGVVDAERALERHREREHQRARHETRDKRSPRLHHVQTAARRQLRSIRKATHHRLI